MNEWVSESFVLPLCLSYKRVLLADELLPSKLKHPAKASFVYARLDVDQTQHAGPDDRIPENTSSFRS